MNWNLFFYTSSKDSFKALSKEFNKLTQIHHVSWEYIYNLWLSIIHFLKDIMSNFWCYMFKSFREILYNSIVAFFKIFILRVAIRHLISQYLTDNICKDIVQKHFITVFLIYSSRRSLFLRPHHSNTLVCSLNVYLLDISDGYLIGSPECWSFSCILCFLLSLKCLSALRHDLGHGLIVFKSAKSSLFKSVWLSKFLSPKHFIVWCDHCFSLLYLCSFICNTVNLMIFKFFWDRWLRIKRCFSILKVLLLDRLQTVIDSKSKWIYWRITLYQSRLGRIS